MTTDRFIFYKMQYSGVTELVEYLGDASDTTEEIMVLATQDSLETIRECIYKRYGVEPSVASVRLFSKFIFLMTFDQMPPRCGMRLILFHPEADIRYKIMPILNSPADHRLFLGDRVIKGRDAIINELKELPLMYPERIGPEVSGARIQMAREY